MGIRAFDASKIRAIANPNTGNEDAHRRPLIVLLGDDREPGQRHCSDDRDNDKKDSVVANQEFSPINVIHR